MAAYQSALSADPPRVEPGTSRALPGTVNAAVTGYFNSAAFRKMAPDSRRTRRGILEQFRSEHGEKRISLLKREHIQGMLNAKADTPPTARKFLSALRALMVFCVDPSVRLRPDDPTQGIAAPRPKPSDGFHTWTEDEIAQFEAVHPIGSRARLAMALLLYTGQRGRSDIVRLGRQHIRAGMIYVRQQKTGTPLEIPMHPDLTSILDATPSGNLTFLVTGKGKPFSPGAFGNWFRQMCLQAGLSHCSPHGLRKAACRRLAEAGCSANVIAAISGHKSLREVERYTKAADQARMARSAIDSMVASFPSTRTSSGKPD
jgi:integrase